MQKGIVTWLLANHACLFTEANVAVKAQVREEEAYDHTFNKTLEIIRRNI